MTGKLGEEWENWGRKTGVRVHLRSRPHHFQLLVCYADRVARLRCRTSHCPHHGLVERIQVVPLEAADAPDDQQGDGQCPGDAPPEPVGQQPLVVTDSRGMRPAPAPHRGKRGQVHFLWPLPHSASDRSGASSRYRKFRQSDSACCQAAPPGRHRA